MNRQEIEKCFDVKDGVITSPGKFEGERLYVPYFWDLFLEGWADSDDGEVIRFRVMTSDREQFPELEKKQRVCLCERSDGFVVEV